MLVKFRWLTLIFQVALNIDLPELIIETPQNQLGAVCFLIWLGLLWRLRGEESCERLARYSLALTVCGAVLHLHLLTHLGLLTCLVAHIPRQQRWAMVLGSLSWLPITSLVLPTAITQAARLSTLLLALWKYGNEE